MWACLVHGRRVDNVLQVLGDVGITIVAQLLDDLEAVEKSAVVLDTRLPLGNPNSVVYKQKSTIVSLEKVRMFLLL